MSEKNVGETLATRQKVARELEDIHNSLVAASQKIARVQLETEDNSTMQTEFDEAVSSLSVLIEHLQGLREDYQLETNRLQSTN